MHWATTSSCRALVGHLMVIDGCGSSGNHAHRQGRTEGIGHWQSCLSLIEEKLQRRSMHVSFGRTGPDTGGLSSVSGDGQRRSGWECQRVSHATRHLVSSP